MVELLKGVMKLKVKEVYFVILTLIVGAVSALNILYTRELQQELEKQQNITKGIEADMTETQEVLGSFYNIYEDGEGTTQETFGSIIDAIEAVYTGHETRISQLEQSVSLIVDYLQ